MQETRIALRNIGKYDGKTLNDAIELGVFNALGMTIKHFSNVDIIESIIHSNLRGRGGAGFPTGLKLQYTASEDSDQKYVICNADEGEPGTFKDRQIMEQDPYLLLEGMAIAGFAIGADTGYIYIRGEYYKSIKRLQYAIDQATEAGFLGNEIFESDFNFHVELRVGAGSYLCGEELTLLESLEGKRGHPRIKPPFPAQKGLFQKPTLVNNVETLAHFPEIISRGSDWYQSLGNNGSSGTKIFNLSGDINKPGYYEFEFGISLRELIYEVGGGISNEKKLKAILLGGAAGTFVSEEQLDTPMDYDSLRHIGATLGSGAVIVLHEDRDLGDFLENILRFFKHESCGKCTPCRVGTTQLHSNMKKINKGSSDNTNLLDKMLKEANLMKATSLCPLGQSPIMPLSTAVKYFKKELLKA